MHDALAPPATLAPPALLAAITADLAAGDDLRALLDRFLEPLVRIADARAGAVRMLAPDGERFELVSTIGLPASLLRAEQLVERHCGFCGHAADQLRVVWAGELGGCAARTGEAFFGQDCQSALAVPLRHGNRLLGIYNLFLNARTEPAPAVLALLRSVGELLGLALEKHRLEAEILRATVAHERQLMAAEIHDSVAQNLTFVKLRLPLLQDAIEQGKQESALAYLDDVRQTLGEAHGSLREIITHFRTAIDPRGLGAALDTLAARFTVRTGIPLHVDNRVPGLRLPEAAQAEVFHIVQEALANIERHARALHGWLRLERTDGRIAIRVEDDGAGPVAAGQVPGDTQAHHGLAIMRERAQRLGGELSVTPRPGGGTTVLCAFPAPAGEPQ